MVKRDLWILNINLILLKKGCFSFVKVSLKRNECEINNEIFNEKGNVAPDFSIPDVNNQRFLASPEDSCDLLVMAGEKCLPL